MITGEDDYQDPRIFKGSQTINLTIGPLQGKVWRRSAYRKSRVITAKGSVIAAKSGVIATKTSAIAAKGIAIAARPGVTHRKKQE